MSLVSCPLPVGPMKRILLPMLLEVGLHAVEGGRASPPHMTVSVPSMARASMPEIGASRNATPFASRGSADRDGGVCSRSC